MRLLGLIVMLGLWLVQKILRVQVLVSCQGVGSSLGELLGVTTGRLDKLELWPPCHQDGECQRVEADEQPHEREHILQHRLALKREEAQPVIALQAARRAGLAVEHHAARAARIGGGGRRRRQRVAGKRGVVAR